jgi:hypothetical protein
MSVATPVVTIKISATKWDVTVTVKVDEAGNVRNARAGEADVWIEDTMETIPYLTLNSTAKVKTDANGQATFRNADYPWLTGFDGPFGPNRFVAKASIPNVASGEKVFFLTRTGWRDPDLEGEGLGSFGPFPDGRPAF